MRDNGGENLSPPLPSPRTRRIRILHQNADEEQDDDDDVSTSRKGFSGGKDEPGEEYVSAEEDKESSESSEEEQAGKNRKRKRTSSGAAKKGRGKSTKTSDLEKGRMDGKRARRAEAAAESAKSIRKKREDLLRQAAAIELENEEEEEPKDDWVFGQFDDLGDKLRCKHCLLLPFRRKGTGEFAKKEEGKIKRSNLSKHLRQSHPTVTNPDGDGARGGGTPATAPSKPPPGGPGQTSMHDHTMFSKERHKEGHDALVVMCALNNRPFNVVEGRGFRYFVNKLTNKRYVLPSRTKLRDRCAEMADHLREGMRNHIKRDVMDGATFTLTFDMWTDSGMRPFICINAHWVSPDTFTYNQNNLVVEYFGGSHTGEAIANVVKGAAGSYGIPLDKVLYCCTDNAANMDVCVAHMKDAPTTRIYCACHWLQLCVNDALKESGRTIVAVEQLKDYISYVGKSSLASQRLEAIQAEKAPTEQPKKLVKEVQTRWSSRYLMIDRAVKMKQYIIIHLAELLSNRQTQSVTKLLGEDFAVLEHTAAVLRPFYKATLLLEGDVDSPMSSVFPQLQKILKALDPNTPLWTKDPVVRRVAGKPTVKQPAVRVPVGDLSEDVRKLRELLRVKLVERWGAESKIHHLYGLYVASAFLDHRYRDNKHIQAFRGRGKKLIEDMAVDMMLKKSSGGEQAGGEGHSKKGGVDLTESDRGGGFSEAQLEFLLAEAEEEEGGEAADGGEEGDVRLTKQEITTKVLKEVKRYFDEKIGFNSLKIPPILWWQAFSGSFPILSKLAARILSIPASSASCERVFSQSGLTLTKLRTRLGRETVANLMMIKYHHTDGKMYHTLKDEEDLNDDNKETGVLDMMQGDEAGDELLDHGKD